METTTDPAPTSAAPEAPASEPAVTDGAPATPEVAPPSSEPESPQAPATDEAPASEPAPGAEEEATPSGDEPDPALSQTDAAGPDGPADPATSYAEWYAGLPPHEQARIDGVPEEYIREGHYWFDDRDGHGKFKDRGAFLKARALNDEYASGFKAKESEYASRIESLESEKAALETARARADAMLKAIGGLTPESESLGDAFVEHFMPEEFQGADPDELDDDRRQAYFEARGLAKQKRDDHFRKQQEEADARVQAQRDHVEAGARYFEERVTPEAFGADSHDKHAAMGKLLAAPLSTEPDKTLADAIRAVAPLAPDLVDAALIGLKVQMHAALGEPVTYPEAASAARRDQQQQPSTERSDAVATKATADPPVSPEAPAEPAIAAPREVPVVEESIETTPVAPTAPGGVARREEPDGLKTTARALSRLRQRGR